MGFFSFLEQPEQEGDAFALQQEQAALRRKKSEPDAESILESSTPGPMQEYKPYSQRRGENASKVFAAADQIIDKYSGQIPDDVRNKYKAEVRAKPDDAAKIVEKYYFGEVYKTAPKGEKIGEPTRLMMRGDPYGPEFAALEDSVRGLRTMKRGAEEKALTGELAATDLKNNLSELTNLRGQLDTLTKEIATGKEGMPEAVSQRGEAEQKRILGDKESKAAAISEHIKQLEALTNQAAPTQPTVNAPPKPAEPFKDPGASLPASANPVTDFMKSLGIDRPSLTRRLHDGLIKVGIAPHEWYDNNVDTTAGVMRVMNALDPQGTLAGLISQQLAEAKQQDSQSQQNKPRQDDQALAMSRTEYQIGQREQEMRALYQSLKGNDFMRTWPGIILYVIVGMLTQNPAFAARLIGGVGNPNAVKGEIQGIQMEIRRLDRQLERQYRDMTESRREAARQIQREQDRTTDHSRDLQKIFLNHKLILERAKQRTSNEFKPIVSKIEGDYNRVMRQMSEAEKIMNNNWLDDDDPKKINASREYDRLKGEAQFLDQKLRKMTEQIAPGTYTEDAGEEEK